MLEKTYTPRILEDRWRHIWSEASCETSSVSKPSFCLIMPPPNVTGSLHLGHALTFTLQDAWARFWRLRGGAVLLQPGLDHAGIATQMVVERQLAEEGKSRQDLGRPNFIEKVWTWKNQSGGKILEQLKRLGVSADWSRTRFTLDPDISLTVRRVFVDLWTAGLIYRDKRLVNWDPAFQTALSDLEVISREISGTLFYICYPFVSEKDSSGGMIVATTRPETLFGDVAIAVHPEDKRYQSLIGRYVKIPLIDRQIPIIADETIDQEKGSGAVKITPAHDFQDFETGRRHHLESITILDEKGCLNENVPIAYQGLDRFQGRTQILKDLATAGLLEKEESIYHAVPHGDRSGVVLEPRLTDQWYLKAEVLADPALKAWEEGKLRFVPENYGEIYANWMRGIRPWCLSRQLWWGHPIPAWYGPDGKVFVAMDEADAEKKAYGHYGESVTLRADPDVLDTWFSSALWPLVTLNWPYKTDEMTSFYPSDVLVTGFDIIFFWVARMVMMGLYFGKDLPFRDVYIHGLLRDSQRQKMSKSKGNVIDPLELMEAYGADALRLTLAAVSTPGRDVTFDPHQVESHRNFITKLWNATRFCLLKGCLIPSEKLPSAKNPVNQWLVHEISGLVADVTIAFETYQFYEAASLLYHFVWGTYCDFYIELVKSTLDLETEEAQETKKVAGWGLGVLLHLLHPLIPFVTEELWAALAPKGSPLSQGSWPLLPPIKTKGERLDFKAFDSYQFPEARDQIQWMISLITATRSVRAENKIPPGTKLPLRLFGVSEAHYQVLLNQEEALKRILKLSSLTIEKEAIPPAEALTDALQIVLGEVTLLMTLDDGVDPKVEQSRLLKALEKLHGTLEVLTSRLASPQFLERASPLVVEEARDRLRHLEAEEKKIQAALTRLPI